MRWSPILAHAFHTVCCRGYALAIEDGELLGIEIGFHGIEYGSELLSPAWAEIGSRHSQPRRTGSTRAFGPCQLAQPGDRRVPTIPRCRLPAARGKQVGMQLLSTLLNGLDNKVWKVRWMCCQTTRGQLLQSMPNLACGIQCPIPERHGVPLVAYGDGVGLRFGAFLKN